MDTVNSNIKSMVDQRKNDIASRNNAIESDMTSFLSKKINIYNKFVSVIESNASGIDAHISDSSNILSDNGGYIVFKPFAIDLYQADTTLLNTRKFEQSNNKKKMHIIKDWNTKYDSLKISDYFVDDENDKLYVFFNSSL